MQRRNFLTMLGAAAAAPLMPARALAAAPAAAASYNRYQYGLAVFHARTRASLSVAEIAQRLKVSGAAAEAMMAEMKASGVIAPVLNSAAGVMRAVSPHQADPRPVTDRLAQKAGELVREAMDDIATDTASSDPIDFDAPEIEEQETDNGKV